MGNKPAAKKRRVQRAPKMAVKQEVIEIDDSCPYPVQSGSPLRPIFCLKNREDIKKFEEQEECFILDFDPYHNLEVLKLPSTVSGDNGEAELSVVAEKGQVILLNFIDFVHDFNLQSMCLMFMFGGMMNGDGFVLKDLIFISGLLMFFVYSLKLCFCY